MKFNVAKLNIFFPSIYNLSAMLIVKQVVSSESFTNLCFFPFNPQHEGKHKGIQIFPLLGSLDSYLHFHFHSILFTFLHLNTNSKFKKKIISLFNIFNAYSLPVDYFFPNIFTILFTLSRIYYHCFLLFQNSKMYVWSSRWLIHFTSNINDLYSISKNFSPVQV
jgi:hypothetical protein